MGTGLKTQESHSTINNGVGYAQPQNRYNRNWDHDILGTMDGRREEATLSGLGVQRQLGMQVGQDQQEPHHKQPQLQKE